MYKELIISIFLFLIIISLDFLMQNYTNNIINGTINEINIVKSQPKEDLLEGVCGIYDKWQENHKKLALFIEHDELEKVETSFVSCIGYLKNNKYDLANTEIENTFFALEHINDKYLINFENIF